MFDTLKCVFKAYVSIFYSVVESIIVIHKMALLFCYMLDHLFTHWLTKIFHVIYICFLTASKTQSSPGSSPASNSKLTQVKAVLMGQVSAGKTSLLNALR